MQHGIDEEESMMDALFWHEGAGRCRSLVVYWQLAAYGTTLLSRGEFNLWLNLWLNLLCLLRTSYSIHDRRITAH